MITKKAFMNFAKYKRDDVVAELDTEKRKSINKMDDESARRMIAEMMREHCSLSSLSFGFSIHFTRDKNSLLYDYSNRTFDLRF